MPRTGGGGRGAAVAAVGGSGGDSNGGALGSQAVGHEVVDVVGHAEAAQRLEPPALVVIAGGARGRGPGAISGRAKPRVGEADRRSGGARRASKGGAR